jgi:hypothetical protein
VSRPAEAIFAHASDDAAFQVPPEAADGLRAASVEFWAARDALQDGDAGATDAYWLAVERLIIAIHATHPAACPDELKWGMTGEVLLHLLDQEQESEETQSEAVHVLSRVTDEISWLAVGGRPSPLAPLVPLRVLAAPRRHHRAPRPRRRVRSGSRGDPPDEPADVARPGGAA